MQNMFSDDGDAHTNHGNKLSTYSKKLTPERKQTQFKQEIHFSYVLLMVCREIQKSCLLLILSTRVPLLMGF